MKYRIRHQTTYRYETAASVSHNVLYLTPRASERQTVQKHRISVQPSPTLRQRRIDTFGNPYEILAVESPHLRLKITADGIVTVQSPAFVDPQATPPWEAVRDAVSSPIGDAAALAAEFTFHSPLVPGIPEALQFARESFRQNRPVLQAAMDMMGRIYCEFRYDPKATTVSTPMAEVFRDRRGVCQDFAHLMIACFRALHLPARYVSGYLETQPPPGQKKLVGVDASHAWVSLWIPGTGWVDLDPTNNIIPGERHITVAWGRDYQDVTPVRGVVLGGGAHELKVSVDVSPVTD